MGAAAEKRFRASSERYFNDIRAKINNNNMARAQFWRDLIEAGHVLTFRHDPTGRTFTAGPYQTALPGHARFALLWGGTPPRVGRDWFAGQAWDIALRVIEYVGRQRPKMIDGERV